MHDPEIQFRAPGGISLADALRDAVGEEGRKPSRTRVRDWIRSGRVRIEGAVVEDPALLLDGGETIDFGPGVEAAAPARSAARAPASILHLDRHLLVACYEPPVAVRAEGGDVEVRLAQALAEAGVVGLRSRPVPAPDARVGGLVAGTLSGASEAALTEAFLAGDAALTVVAAVATEPGADLGELALIETDSGPWVRDAAVRSVPAFLADLLRRGVTVRSVPGAGRGRPLLAHVAALRLPHPRTGREHTWQLPPPPSFPGAPGSGSR